jgi:hypothetical protein
MDYSKIKTKYIFRGLLWISIGLIFTETIHQVYLRSKWVNGNYYKWEDYAFKRNKQRMIYLENYFKQNQDKSFIFSENPDEGSLEGLSKEAQAAIIDLRNDLIKGSDLIGNRKYFEFNFQKISDTQYIIYIHAGATFKANFNGYNFDAIITNADSSYHQGYEATDVANIFVNKEYNRNYRSSPFILRYNCNSFDLLILKCIR